LKIYVVAWRLISADFLQIKSPGNTTGSIYSLQKEETLRRVALCSPSLIRRLISLFNSRGNQGRRRTAEERERREPEGPGCLCYGMETGESLLLLVLGPRDMLGRKVLSKLSVRGAAAARA